MALLQVKQHLDLSFALLACLLLRGHVYDASFSCLGQGFAYFAGALQEPLLRLFAFALQLLLCNDHVPSYAPYLHYGISYPAQVLLVPLFNDCLGEALSHKLSPTLELNVVLSKALF